MAKSIRSENVYNVFLQPPCSFRRVIGVQLMVNSICELLASRVPLSGRNQAINFRHIDSNGPRWLIDTACHH